MVQTGQVKSKGRQIVRTKQFSLQTQQTLYVRAGRQVEASAVILTAQRPEYDALFDHFNDPNFIELECEGKGFKTGEFSSDGILWHISVAKIGPHNEVALGVAMQAIQCFKPQIVLFVGTAGGVDREELRYGHVVVVKEAFNIDRGIEDPDYRPPKVKAKKRSDKELIRIAEQCIESEDWKKRIKQAILENEPEARSGQVATTGATITSRDAPALVKIRRFYPKVLTIDQESFGFLTGAEFGKKPAIVIRGVADFCGDDWETAEDSGNKKRAMMNASAFAFELLAKITPNM
jgi:nucleoside phosphorylase